MIAQNKRQTIKNSYTPFSSAERSVRSSSFPVLAISLTISDFVWRPWTHFQLSANRKLFEKPHHKEHTFFMANSLLDIETVQNGWPSDEMAHQNKSLNAILIYWMLTGLNWTKWNYFLFNLIWSRTSRSHCTHCVLHSQRSNRMLSASEVSFWGGSSARWHMDRVGPTVGPSVDPSVGPSVGLIVSIDQCVNPD